MNEYQKEQLLTDRYGDTIMHQIAATYFDKHNIERVTDRETQIKGIDYYFSKKTTGRAIKQMVDLKYDTYENENFVFELDTQYIADGIHDASWVNHNGDILIAYFKIYQRKVYIIKLSELQEFMKTELFTKRKVFETNFRINGKPAHFKNFKFEELPVDRIIPISLMQNPFEMDNLLDTKSSTLQGLLYQEQ